LGLPNVLMYKTY